VEVGLATRNLIGVRDVGIQELVDFYQSNPFLQLGLTLHQSRKAFKLAIISNKLPRAGNFCSVALASSKTAQAGGK
jgi:hypothetical protein